MTDSSCLRRARAASSRPSNGYRRPVSVGSVFVCGSEQGTECLSFLAGKKGEKSRQTALTDETPLQLPIGRSGASRHDVQLRGGFEAITSSPCRSLSSPRRPFSTRNGNPVTNDARPFRPCSARPQGQTYDSPTDSRSAHARERYLCTDTLISCSLAAEHPISDSSAKLRADSSPLSAFSTDSQAHFGDPCQTIVVFDWDDTIFPTNWIEHERFPETLAPSLEEIDLIQRVACSLLTMAGQLSCRVCIITNAQRPWVTESARRFLPMLSPLLEGPFGPSIIYARECLFCPRGSTSKDLTISKVWAMESELGSFYSQYPNQSWKNVISIGDSWFEHDAVRQVTSAHPQPQNKKLRTKTIKLTTRPSLAEVGAQLSVLREYLSAIVRYDGDMNVVFDSVESGIDNLSRALRLPTTPPPEPSRENAPFSFITAY
eukprot:TRINITY_DN52495_c0_g1_i1.p1 TRINITY_DN52495_c0_g1~~TRINITY_DN52495_c0_g1_i1.p1  ORF type:complete len:431 (-),score=30.95 TRINITY_DN52495_c0_g1_i1:23-1315(-)